MDQTGLKQTKRAKYCIFEENLAEIGGSTQLTALLYFFHISLFGFDQYKDPNEPKGSAGQGN